MPTGFNASKECLDSRNYPTRCQAGTIPIVQRQCRCKGFPLFRHYPLPSILQMLHYRCRASVGSQQVPVCRPKYSNQMDCFPGETKMTSTPVTVWTKLGSCNEKRYTSVKCGQVCYPDTVYNGCPGSQTPSQFFYHANNQNQAQMQCNNIPNPPSPPALTCQGDLATYLAPCSAGDNDCFYLDYPGGGQHYNNDQNVAVTCKTTRQNYEIKVTILRVDIEYHKCKNTFEALHKN